VNKHQQDGKQGQRETGVNHIEFDKTGLQFILGIPIQKERTMPAMTETPWVQLVDERNGNVYFHNTRTGRSQVCMHFRLDALFLFSRVSSLFNKM
jgi:hypothetical protein